MQGSASARALGSSREPAGGGLAARKEQVQKEILEQKALIEKLEGRVASLSGRGRRSTGTRVSSGSPLSDDTGRGTSPRRQGTDARPATTPDLECVTRKEESHDLNANGGARTGNKPSFRRTSRAKEVADHGPNARRDSHHVASTSALHGANDREELSAVSIQRNVRGIGRRKRFLTLRSAREELERHLLALVIGAGAVGERGDSESRAMAVSAAALRLLDTSRKDGLAKPPFEILRAMYSGIDDIAAGLASYSRPFRGDARSDSSAGRRTLEVTLMESCDAAKEAMDAIREAVGADTEAVVECTSSPGAAASSSPGVARDQRNSPAGSGRAAAVAMASTRGGLLVCSDDLPKSSQATLAERSSRVSTESRHQNGQIYWDENRHPQSVPLRSLDVAGVARLLNTHGFEEEVPGFVSQSVDGVMLSDPNLCEADLAELGLGGDEADAAHDCRVRMVSLFRRSQQEGVLLPPGTESPSCFGEGFGSKSNERNDERYAGGSILDDLRGNKPDAGRITEIGTGDGVPDDVGGVQRASSEESSWRRKSVLVDRQNQRMLAQIPLEPSETGREGERTSTSGRGGRSLSVKLNQGVVVTAGGLEAGLIDNAEDEIGAAEVEAAAKGESKALAATPSGETSSANARRRRTSVGIPKVPLYTESDDGIAPGLGGRLSPLPPDVTVTTADETLNVFR
ncbi:unnamed protein product [Scytosiphon promiscuus]